MASMLFDRAPAGATLNELESLRDAIVSEVADFAQRRSWKGERCFVAVGEIRKDTRTGNCFFVVQFPDTDKRAPKVVKKVIRRARRAEIWKRINRWVKPDFGHDSAGDKEAGHRPRLRGSHCA